MKKQGFYVGIDIDDEYAVISYYDSDMKEPLTMSMITGSDLFQIPVLLAKRKGMGQWYIGNEAKQLKEREQVIFVEHLYEKALRKENVYVDEEHYPAEELLLLFLRKLISYACGISSNYEPGGVAVSVEDLDRNKISVFSDIFKQMGYANEEIHLIDRKDAFYYFALNQQKELWLHDVLLYDYRDHRITCFHLHRNANVTPQLITIREIIKPMDDQNKDEAFFGILADHLKGKIVSTIYLVGNGFDGNWMKQSLNYMCQGRRAFVGKNLYAKGCCYLLKVLETSDEWMFTYLGNHQMKMNVSLKVIEHGKETLYPLLRIGDQCFEAKGSCEVILSDTKSIPIWLQSIDSKQAKVETLTLTDLPERESRTTRVRITAQPLSDMEVQIQIKDLGFGEIVKSSNQYWEYKMSL